MFLRQMSNSTVKVNSKWPWCLAIDSGTDHPTAAVLATVSPEGVYTVADFYCEAMLKMRQHSAAFMRMVGQWQQFTNPRFIALMVDHRDKYFPIEVLDHTEDRLRIGLLKPEKGDTRAILRLECIRKIETIMASDKLVFNRSSPYYETFMKQWGGYRWDPKQKDLPKPIKLKDDLVNALEGAIYALHPVPEREIVREFTETREPGLDQIERIAQDA